MSSIYYLRDPAIKYDSGLVDNFTSFVNLLTRSFLLLFMYFIASFDILLRQLFLFLFTTTKAIAIIN